MCPRTEPPAQLATTRSRFRTHSSSTDGIRTSFRFALPRHALDCGEQVGNRDRFGEEVVHPGGQAAVAVFLPRPRRECHNRKVSSHLLRVRVHGSRESPETRPFPACVNRAERKSKFSAVSRSSTFAAVRRGVNRVTAARQAFFNQPRVEIVIFRDENACSGVGTNLGDSHSGLHYGAGSKLSGECERYCRAPARSSA